MSLHRRSWTFACLALISIASALIAYWRSFSRMVPYDDEGTMMLSLDRFFRGQPLYDSVQTIYGPFYYFYEWLAHTLTGSPVSHDLVRWVSVTWWVAAAAVLFLLVWRATGSLILAVVAQYVAFRDLGFIGLETAHPQEACITLLLLVALAAALRGRPAVRWLLIGGFAGIIVLCKINLGALVLASMGVVFAFALPEGIFGRLVRVAASLAALSLAPLLMAANLRHNWTQVFALVITISVAASLAACARYRIEPRVCWQDAAAAASGLLISLAAVAAFPLAFHSTPHGMFFNLVIFPSTRFAQSWSNPMHISTVAIAWTVANLALAIHWWRRALPEWAVIFLKLGFAGLVLAFTAIYGLHDLMGLGAPMLWLAAVPAPGAAEEHKHSILRPLLAVMGVLQILYAYPVAGAQAQFATVIFVAIAALNVHDVLPWLAARIPIPARTAAVAAALGVAAMYAHDLISAAGRYRSFESLALPGAYRLHVEPGRAAIYRRIADAAHSCSMLVSEPGIYSLNLFSGVPAPPSVSAGLWMLFDTDEQQRLTVGELQRQSAPCAVVNAEVVKFWAGNRDLSRQPLVRYIHDDLQLVFQAGDYEFRARR